MTGPSCALGSEHPAPSRDHDHHRDPDRDHDRDRDRMKENPGKTGCLGPSEVFCRQNSFIWGTSGAETTKAPDLCGRALRSRAEPYFLLRRWWRVLRSSLRCFFLAIRLRRFLMTEPIKIL